MLLAVLYQPAAKSEEHGLAWSVLEHRRPILHSFQRMCGQDGGNSDLRERRPSVVTATTGEEGLEM
jgi:hypothetical protein